MGDLRVELYGRLVGHLVGTSSRTFDFRTDRSVLEHWSPGSTVLSEAVPLSLVENRARAARRRNYFAELLPEGRILSALAARAGVAESDDVGLLARYGRDVAGAVELHDPDAPGEPRTPRATPLTAEQVGALLRDSRGMPLGNSPSGGRSSLAGVQDKIVLAGDRAGCRHRDAPWRCCRRLGRGVPDPRADRRLRDALPSASASQATRRPPGRLVC